MLPVMGSPGVVEEFAGFFRQLFSWHQYRRFKQYLSGLITGGKTTLHSIAKLVERADQSSLNRSLTLYWWEEERLNMGSLDLLQSREETKWQRISIVAIDDTLLAKAGRRISGAGKLWNHTAYRYVHAQCLVTGHYTDHEKDYPIGFEQYFKYGSLEVAEHARAVQ